MRTSEIILPAYWKGYNFKGRYRVYKGSRASGKSSNVALEYIVKLVKHKNTNLLVVRMVDKDHRKSTYPQLLWAINKLGLKKYFRSTKSPLEIEYIPTGQKILFAGLNDPSSLTSIKATVGEICWVWFEEAYQIQNEEDFDRVDESIRGTMPEGVFPQITLTFNPYRADHWLKSRFFDVKDPDIFTLTTTYKDNAYLTDRDLEYYERMKEVNPMRFRVAGQGEWGITEGLLYNFTDQNILHELDKYIDFSAGIDYGIKKDAYSISVIGYTANYKEAHIIREYYHSNDKSLNKKTHNDYIDDTMAFFKELDIVLDVYIDNSAAFLVEFLNERTFKEQFFKPRFHECKKLHIEERVGYVSGLIDEGKLKISTDCPNHINEYTNIEIAEVASKVRQGSDHAIDSSEYALTPYFKLLVKEY